MSQGQRRLAAIMFTDMVGYTALGQRNESLSLALVDEQRKLARPILSRHNGREVKTMGDAFLVEFPSALDAIRCAYEIQRTTREYNVSLPDEQRIHLRVGVHLGDVVESQGDISGDAVNIASRVEPLAEDGGVCLTHEVYNQVRNKIELGMESMGLHSLKNVNLPMEVFKILMPWDREKTNPPELEGLDSHRVAILPFVSLSPDPNDEYFADGLTEELIDRLCQVRGLEVIARTSVMSFKNKEKRAAEIGRELSAGALVEGSVRKAGGKVRVTAQLINANTEGHLWSSTYDRNLEDIFAVQSDIAEAVAGALKVRLLPKEKLAIQKKDTEDPEAHDLYLKGLFHTQRITEEEYMTALGYFERAIQRDPGYSLAYAATANVYGFLGFFEMMPSREAFGKADMMARKAIELNESLAEAHASLASTFSDNWNIEGASKEIQRALELNPNLAEAHWVAASIFFFLRQFGEALRESRRALELDPLSVSRMQQLATIQLYSGQVDAAEELFRKALELDPAAAFATGNLGLCLVRKGMYDAGIDKIRKAIAMSSNDPSRQSDLIYALAKAGRIDEARNAISELIEFYDKHGRGAAPIAYGFASLGDIEKALEWLQTAYNEHSGYLVGASVDFSFEDKFTDPRLQEFFKRIGTAQKEP